MRSGLAAAAASWAGFTAATWVVSNHLPGNGSVGALVAAGLLVGGWALLALWSFAERDFSAPSLTCFLIALIVATLYFAVTPPSARQYDMEGHMAYIRRLQIMGALPKLREGWESYHPPGYYLVALAWKSLFRGDESRILQILSWLLYSMNVIAGGALWARLEKKEDLHWFGALVFALIPGTLFFSARINNDVPLPLLGILTLGGVLAYWRAPRASLALGIGIVSTLAMAAKLNSLALWGAALVAVCLEPDGMFRPTKLGNRQRIRDVSLVLLPGLAFLIPWMAHNISETGVPLYSNFAHLDRPLLVPNNFYRFFSFDFRAFLTQDGARPWDGDLRTSFPTYAATTYLFGEFSFPPGWVFLVTTVRAAFLPALACLTLALAGARRHYRSSPLFRASLLLSTFQLLFLIALSIKQPASCSMDARYLAPAFFPIAVLFSFGIRDSLGSANRWARRSAKTALVAFPALLAAFYVLLLKGG